MLTVKTINDIESILSQRAGIAPAPVVEAPSVSAWFSVSDEGVAVDSLIVMTLAPGTRRERTAVGIVERRDRPTLVQLPDADAATLTSGLGSRATDEFVTGGGAAGGGASSTAVSRYGETQAGYDVTSTAPSSEAMRFPAVSLADEGACTKERIWRRVATQIEILSAAAESGSDRS